MALGNLENLGIALARARQQGKIDGIPLNRIASPDEAERVQLDAVAAYGGNPRGYVLEGTSARVQGLVCCDEPIFGPLLDRDLIEATDEPFRLPYGVLGAGCGFAFVLGLPFPDDDAIIDQASVGRALVTCFLGVQVLGRRVPGTIPLNALTATADFALNVGYRLGPRIEHWHEIDLEKAGLTVRINGRQMTQGTGDRIMGHPLEAVVWLARALAARGRQLEPGEIIAVGSCVGILQVLPGQTLEADAGPLGGVTLTFA
jgi:2-keto-4-pentenoate hydratase